VLSLHKKTQIMSSNFEQFKALHHQQEPLVLGNAWDVQSATVLEKLGIKAIGTSSAAVAGTLGYNDGENMPFDEYFFLIKRIKSSVSVPLSVDLEAGYGKTEEAIVQNIQRLHELGVAGINIEDTIVDGNGRSIMPADRFAGKMKNITARLAQLGIDIFINLRSDAFLLGLPDAGKEAVQRIKAYEHTGVHSIFLPCITAVDDIKAAVAATQLPVSVMCMPGLPDFRTLQSLGIKRISMGNFVHGTLYKKMEEITGDIISEGSFSGLFK
jgi:2-methylisocitrate lyase-like PEP mutase family enzyme